jgi:hypothetical protein
MGQHSHVGAGTKTLDKSSYGLPYVPAGNRQVQNTDTEHPHCASRRDITKPFIELRSQAVPLGRHCKAPLRGHNTTYVRSPCNEGVNPLPKVYNTTTTLGVVSFWRRRFFVRRMNGYKKSSRTSRLLCFSSRNKNWRVYGPWCRQRRLATRVSLSLDADLHVLTTLKPL